MPTLPTVHGTGAALYPIPRSNTIACGVQKFLTGAEQRFKRAASLASFQLKYTGLFAGDRDRLKNFYATTKGAFDSTWSFSLTNTFGACTFLDDAFQSVEGARPNLYDVTLNFRQTIKGGAVAGAGTNFPVLSTGATSQRPYTQVVRYRTVKNDNPTGRRYAFAFYNSGLTGFPVRGLMSWKLEYPAITDADMATLEAFFVAMNGRWQTFSFTDPEDHVVYNKVRFDMDAIIYNYVQLNQASTTILLAETN